MQNCVSPCRGQNREQGSDRWERTKATEPKEDAISFKICRAKKYEVHERLGRKKKKKKPQASIMKKEPPAPQTTDSGGGQGEKE